MNCGYCAEFCPFDAIKMDHDYELASYDRTSNHIYDKARLSKEFSYWKSIAPTTAVEEMEARGGWEHTDVLKERKKAERRPASSPSVTGQQAATSEAAAAQASNEQTTARAEVSGQQMPEAAASAVPVQDEEAAKAERLRKREEALARKRAREAGEKSE
jgi:NADH-quinone oxidoreductase subunit I